MIPLDPDSDDAAAADAVEKATPSPADGVERSVDPQSVAVSRIARGVFTAVVALSSLISVSVWLLTASPGRTGVLIGMGAWLVVTALLAVLNWVWPGVSYRYLFYRLDERLFSIRRGVIWRSEIVVPRSRIQHTDVSRGPIERMFGLATLIVHTAGTEQASVSLSGLAESNAEHIRDFLVETDDGDAV